MQYSQEFLVHADLTMRNSDSVIKQLQVIASTNLSSSSDVQ